MTVLADHGAPLGVSTWRAFNSAATERADIPANSENRRNGPCSLQGARLSRFVDCGQSRAAELDTPRLGCRKAGFGSVADHAAFLLRHRGINVDHEGVGARHVAGHEINLALHQAADEMDVARKSVQLRNDKLCLVLPASLQGLFKLRAIRPLAALDLGKLAHQLPTATVQIILDRLPLSGHAVAVHALMVGGNAVICDEFAVHEPAV